MGRFQHGIVAVSAAEWPWLALAGQLLTLVAQTGIETTLSFCRWTISGAVGSFSQEGHLLVKDP